MTLYAPNTRVLAPLPDYSGTAVFLAACMAISAVAYLLIADGVSSNLALNVSLIAVSCALIMYCARATWTLYQASDLMDSLDGTVELGRPSRAELLQLSARAQKVRRVLDVKSLRAIIQSIQARGDFVLTPDAVMQMRSRAEKASLAAERGTDAGMLIVPFLALSMGAWTFINNSTSGGDLNAAILSPLMVGFLSASLLVMLNKQSQHASRLFFDHFQQWITLRSTQSSEQDTELSQLRASVEQLEHAVKHNERLAQQQEETIRALIDAQEEPQSIAAPVLIQGQKIVQQANDTRRVIQSTRTQDRRSGQAFPQNASNDEHTAVNIDQGRNNGQDRSAAA